MFKAVSKDWANWRVWSLSFYEHTKRTIKQYIYIYICIYIYIDIGFSNIMDFMCNTYTKLKKTIDLKLVSMHICVYTERWFHFLKNIHFLFQVFYQKFIIAFIIHSFIINLYIYIYHISLVLFVCFSCPDFFCFWFVFFVFCCFPCSLGAWTSWT